MKIPGETIHPVRKPQDQGSHSRRSWDRTAHTALQTALKLKRANTGPKGGPYMKGAGPPTTAPETLTFSSARVMDSRQGLGVLEVPKTMGAVNKPIPLVVPSTV